MCNKRVQIKVSLSKEEFHGEIFKMKGKSESRMVQGKTSSEGLKGYQNSFGLKEKNEDGVFFAK